MSAARNLDPYSEAPPGPRPKILFVDDEPMILRSIRRLLEQLGDDWELLFAPSGAEALEIMAEHEIDVIVSDMHMDRMNGAVLLTRVQHRHPGVVRIVLSGHTDPKLVYRAVPVAHQFLSKPFDPVMLRSTIRRACRLRTLLESEAMRRVVGAKNELPSAPKVYTELVQALSNPEVSVRAVGEIIERDVAMSSRLIQLVSSAFFGLPQRVSTVGGACAYVGIDTIKALVLSVEIFQMFKTRRKSLSMDEFNHHSLMTGQLAYRMLEGHESADHAFLAGMLHDVGQLIIAARIPDTYTMIREVMDRDEVSVHDAERGVLGMSHADLGAYLLGLWGLPQAVVEAVAGHHRVGRVPEESFGPLGAVQVASRLIHDIEKNPIESAGLNECAEALGLSDRLPQWRKLAWEIAQQSDDD